MITEKLIKLAKELVEILLDEKRLAFRKAQWATEARKEFKSDDRFVVWLKSDCNLTDVQAREMVAWSTAGKIVHDEKTWIRLGGAREILAVRNLTPKQQVEVFEAAKATGSAVRTLAKDRYPKAFDMPAPVVRTIKMNDADRLSRFIAERINSIGKLPPDIEVIVRMYVPSLRAPRRA